VWHAPAGAPRAGAVVCHPHPQYGGDMDNSVVVAVARALERAGMAALRFNFGGVGASEGVYDDGRAERNDVYAAAAALVARVPPGTPLAIVGYSFGAMMGAMAAGGLPRIGRVVAIAPPLAFGDWSFAATLAKPLHVIVGSNDRYCPLDAVARLAASAGARPTVLAGADHFFAGREEEVAATVLRHVVEPPLSDTPS